MFLVEQGIIKISRGNYGSLFVPLKDKDGADYSMVTGDRLILIVKKTPNDDAVLLQKESNSQYFTFAFEDTSNLEFDTYSYDVTLVHADGSFLTVVCPTDFYVMEANYRGEQ